MTGRTRSISPYLNKKCMCRTNERTPHIPLARLSRAVVVERCGATCALVARSQKGSERWYSKKYCTMSSRLAQRRPSGGCSAAREEIDATMFSLYRASYERALALACTELGENTFVETIQEGARHVTGTGSCSARCPGLSAMAECNYLRNTMYDRTHFLRASFIPPSHQRSHKIKVPGWIDFCKDMCYPYLQIRLKLGDTDTSW
jgi:hypothetical protein